MNCEQALLLLSGHLDGQNTPEEESALTQHLETCASCRGILAAYEAVDQGVAQLEQEPPTALLLGVMDRIHADHSAAVKPKKRRFFFGPGTAIAAVAAALLLILGTGNFQNLQLGKTSSVDANPDAQMPMAQSAAENPEETYAMPETASIDAPMNSSTDVVAPHVDASLATAPRSAQMQAKNDPETIDGTPHLLIANNPEKPALTSIAELADLETYTDEAGVVWYMTDAKTARAIAAAYEADYVMEPYLLGEEASDAALCLIAVQ